jgi:hypothetical protein
MTSLRFGVAFAVTLLVSQLLLSASVGARQPYHPDVSMPGWTLNNHPGGGPYVSIFEQCPNFDLLLVHDRFGIVEPRPGWWYAGQDEHVPGYLIYRRPQNKSFQQIWTVDPSPH